MPSGVAVTHTFRPCRCAAPAKGASCRAGKAPQARTYGTRLPVVTPIGTGCRIRHKEHCAHRRAARERYAAPAQRHGVADPGGAAAWPVDGAHGRACRSSPPAGAGSDRPSPGPVRARCRAPLVTQVAWLRPAARPRPAPRPRRRPAECPAPSGLSWRASLSLAFALRARHGGQPGAGQRLDPDHIGVSRIGGQVLRPTALPLGPRRKGADALHIRTSRHRRNPATGSPSRLRRPSCAEPGRAANTSSTTPRAQRIRTTAVSG